MVNHSRGLVEMFAAVHAIWLPQRIGSWWMTSFHGDMRSYQSGDYEHVCNDLAPHLQSNHPHTVHCWRSIFNWQNLKHPCRAIVKHSQIDHQHTSEIPTIANYGWFIVVYGIALLTFTNIEFKSYGWLKNLLNSTLLNLTKHLYYILLYIYCIIYVRIYWFILPFTKRSPNMDHRFATDSPPSWTPPSLCRNITRNFQRLPRPICSSASLAETNSPQHPWLFVECKSHLELMDFIGSLWGMKYADVCMCMCICKCICIQIYVYM